MNISEIAKSSAAAAYLSGKQQPAAQATEATSSAPTPLAKAESRVKTQLDATSAQLTTFGKLKSAVSDVQLAAQSLGSLAKDATAATAKSAASKLVSAFNGAVNLSKTSAPSGDASSTNNNATTRVGAELSRSLRFDPVTQSSLTKLGISSNSDGTLSIDSTKFDIAQKADPAGAQAALAKMGQAVNKAATKELAAGGAVTGSIDVLSKRSLNLSAQQSGLQALEKQIKAATPSATSAALSAYTASY